MGCEKCRILYGNETIPKDLRCEECGGELVRVDPAELANPSGMSCLECGYGMFPVEDCWAWHGGGCSTDCDPWIHCIGCDMRVKWECKVCGYAAR